MGDVPLDEYSVEYREPDIDGERPKRVRQISQLLLDIWRGRSWSGSLPEAATAHPAATGTTRRLSTPF